MRISYSLVPAAAVLALGGLALTSTFSPAIAASKSPAEFYKGTELRFISSSSAGGGYDAYARTVAATMSKHLPGHPDIIVQNMPGAGGLKATNFLYNAAPRDGSVIGGVQNPIAFQPLLGEKGARYDALKFNWIGSANSETALMLIWHTAPYHTIAQLQKHKVPVSATGGGASPAFYGRVLNATLGTKLEIVTGYKGSSDALLAMERGEVMGYPCIFLSTLRSKYPTWISEKKVYIPLQMGLEKNESLGDIPWALDVVKGDDNRKAMELTFAPLAMGRPYLAPPGVPADRVAALRKAFMDTINDPKFRADAKKRHLTLDAPKSGKQVQALIKRIYTQTPDRVVKMVASMRKG